MKGKTIKQSIKACFSSFSRRETLNWKLMDYHILKLIMLYNTGCQSRKNIALGRIVCQHGTEIAIIPYCPSCHTVLLSNEEVKNLQHIIIENVQLFRENTIFSQVEFNNRVIYWHCHKKQTAIRWLTIVTRKNRLRLYRNL